LGYEPNELPDCSTPQLNHTILAFNGQTRGAADHDDEVDGFTLVAA